MAPSPSTSAVPYTLAKPMMSEKGTMCCCDAIYCICVFVKMKRGLREREGDDLCVALLQRKGCFLCLTTRTVWFVQPCRWDLDGETNCMRSKWVAEGQKDVRERNTEMSECIYEFGYLSDQSGCFHSVFQYFTQFMKNFGRCGPHVWFVCTDDQEPIWRLLYQDHGRHFAKFSSHFESPSSPKNNIIFVI